MGGGKGGSTSTVTIPPEVLARYNAVNAQAEQTAKQPFSPYTGQFVSGLSPTQQAGILNTNTGASLAQPYYEAATRGTQGALNSTTPYQAGATAFTLAGGQNVGPLTQQQIQYYQQPITSSVINPTLQALQQQQAQQNSALQSQMIQQGAFGGSRGGLQQAELQRQQLLGTSQALAPIYQQAYQSALQTATGQQGVVASDLARQLQTGQQLAGLGQQGYQQQIGAANQLAGIGTGAQSAALQGAQAQIAAGGTEQQTAQADLTARYNQYLQQQGYPFQVAQFLANIAEGTGALSGSTTTTTGGGGFFSDRRLKEDVKEIGKTHDGQPIYSYRYANDNDGRTQIGLMAQDVEKKHPEAVGVLGGYKTVDYKAATQDAERPARAMGGVIPNSMGGAVFTPGTFAGGGLVSENDWDKIRQVQLAGLGPFGAKAPGGTPGMSGYVPSAALPVTHLVSSKPPTPNQANLGTALQTGSNIASGIKNIKGLYADLTGKDAAKTTTPTTGRDSNTPDKTGTTGGNTGEKTVQKPEIHSEANASDVAAPNTAPVEIGLLDDKDKIFDFGSFAARGGVIPRKHYRLGGGNVDPYNSDPDMTYFPEQALQASQQDAEAAEDEFKKRQAHAGSGGGGGGSALGTLSSIASIGSTLFSMFSDERLKHNIKPVGKTYDGQNIYSFNMGDGKTRMGLIAQEVLHHKPDAVGLSHGFLTVDYDRATEHARPHRAEGGLVPSRMAYQRAGVVPSDDNYDPQADLPSPRANDAGVNTSGADDDHAARTILTEAGNQGDIGMAAVGHVIKNRADSGKYGDTVADVVTAPKQFSPWNEENKGTAVDPRRISPDSPSYQKAMDVWNRVKSGDIEDPTKGATHFANVKTVLAQRGDLQPWLANMLNNPETVQIGAHTFGKAGDEGAGGGKKRGVSVSDNEPTSPQIGRGSSLGDVFEKATPDFVPTSSNFWIPALSGIGSMLASRNPTLGGAIGEGLVGGVAGYETNKKMQMDQAKQLIDLVGKNYQIIPQYDPVTKTVSNVAINKLTGQKTDAGEINRALSQGLSNIGVDPASFGIVAPQAPKAPGDTSGPTNKPSAQSVAAGAEPSTDMAAKEYKRLANMPTTDMNVAELKKAAEYGIIPGVIGDPNFNIQQKRQEAEKLRALAVAYGEDHPDKRSTAIAQADKIDAEIDKRLTDATSDKAAQNLELQKSGTAGYNEYKKQIANRYGQYDTELQNLNTLQRIASELTTGNVAEIQAKIAGYVRGTPMERLLSPDWQNNSAQFGYALKEAAIRQMETVAENKLVRAPAAGLKTALASSPDPRQDPGAFYAIIGQIKGELFKNKQKDSDFLDAPTGTDVARFERDWANNPKNADKNFRRQALDNVPVHPAIPSSFIRGIQEDVRGPNGETFNPAYKSTGANQSTQQAPAAAPAIPNGTAVGEEKQFKQGVGVWDGTKWVPKGGQ